jgi:hypothetical protein
MAPREGSCFVDRTAVRRGRLGCDWGRKKVTEKREGDEERGRPTKGGVAPLMV